VWGGWSDGRKKRRNCWKIRSAVEKPTIKQTNKTPNAQIGGGKKNGRIPKMGEVWGKRKQEEKTKKNRNSWASCESKKNRGSTNMGDRNHCKKKPRDERKLEGTQKKQRLGWVLGGGKNTRKDKFSPYFLVKKSRGAREGKKKSSGTEPKSRLGFPGNSGRKKKPRAPILNDRHMGNRRQITFRGKTGREEKKNTEGEERS